MPHTKNTHTLAVSTIGLLLIATSLVILGNTRASISNSISQTPVSALDPTFGNGGKVTTDFSGMLDEPQAIAIQPVDGKIVVAGTVNMNVNTGGDIGLIRYNPNGTLDGTFGIGGKVVTDFSGGDEDVLDMAIQTDGRIVAVGEAGHDFLIVRYNPGGTLDSSFGNGGKVVTDISGSDYAAAIAIESGGKLVAAGVSRGNDAIIVARYNPNGSLDESFGSGGKVITDISGSTGASDVAIQPDGKVVVVATSYVTNIDSVFTLVRYTNNGALDSTFGNGGQVFTGFFGETVSALSIVIQTDGKLVVAGECFNGSNLDFALARYDRNGALDDSFGSGGKVNTDFGGREDGAAALALQGDRIVVIGTTGNDASTTVDFAVACYNTHGALDSSFGLGGKATTDFFDNFDEALAVAIQPDGKIVLAGRAMQPTDAGDFALARYMGGVVDTTPPVLTLPSTITMTATSPAGAVVTYSVTATDNLDPNPVVSCTPQSGSTFPIGSTGVNCTATDASNNSASDSFTVVVAQAGPPPPPPPPPALLQRGVATGPITARPNETIANEADLRNRPSNLLFRIDTDPSQSTIGIIKNSGNSWVRLWADWPTLQPALDRRHPDHRPGVPLENIEADSRTRPFIRSLDEQIIAARQQGFKVILTAYRFPLWVNNHNPDGKIKPKFSPENLVPNRLGEGSDWAKWISFLIKRYGYSTATRDTLRYIDFLEVCNEPNLGSQMWPQSRNGRLLIDNRVAQMFITAQRQVRERNRKPEVSAVLDAQHPTTIKLAGPAATDDTTNSAGRTPYQKFTRELLKRLKGHFIADKNFAWTQHNYGDVEQGRDCSSSRCGVDRVNAAAWVRRRLVGGVNGYKWTGWPGGDNNPYILLTEGGARLNVVYKNLNYPKIGEAPNFESLKEAQRDLVDKNFQRMASGVLSQGIALVTNYLAYSDPCADTGLYDFVGPLTERERKDCFDSTRTHPEYMQYYPNISLGAKRPLYDRWSSLPP